MRTHRVGTLTLGGSLIVFGVLFSMRIFTDAIDYHMILRLWPLVLIGLGIEILLSAALGKKEKLTYDGPAILLTCLLSVFTMCMAGVQLALEYSTHITI